MSPSSVFLLRRFPMKTRIRYLASNAYVCSTCARPSWLRSRTYATAATSPSEVYDVICIGGGPVGLSLLTALRSSPVTARLKLALVEAHDLDPLRQWDLGEGQFSNRASSLTPATLRLLSDIGVWPYVDSSRVQPYRHMRVWDGLDTSSAISFSESHPAIATMTENPNLTKALLKRLDDLAPATVHEKTKVVSIDAGPTASDEASLDLSSYPIVNLSSGHSLAARLLVGADGLDSPVRTFAGIQTRGWDYERHGVVATVKYAARDIFNDQYDTVTAYQRFLPSGPIALLALPNDYATLVWSTTPEKATQLKSLAPEDFTAMVNAGFRLDNVDLEYMSKSPKGQLDELNWRLSVTSIQEDEAFLPRKVESVQDGSVASFPLRYRQADSYISFRIALLGDAAHTIHPLAGQGLNMGLADVESLARTIEYTVQHGGDIGDEMYLERYNAEMWMQNNRMLGVTDKLHKLYGVGWGPLVGVRSLGLKMVDQMGPVKSWLMRQAGGVGA